MIETLVNGWQPDAPFVLDALRDAEVRALELLYDSSNYVFLVVLAHPEHGEGLAVYKPVSGEAPLSDFPYGTLHRREVAAYELSRLLGWGIVPPVVEREVTPLMWRSRPGSCYACKIFLRASSLTTQGNQWSESPRTSIETTS